MSFNSDSKRPGSMTVFIGFTLFIPGLAFTRIILTIHEWRFLSSEFITFSPFFIIISGIALSIFSIPLAIGIWKGLPIAWSALQIYFLLISAFYWIEKIVLSALTEWTSNWIFSIILTLIILLWVAWILSRPRIKTYFKIYV